MIRLKPSELILTPEDVDDTFRRMARRQPPRQPPPAQRRTRASGNGRPLAPRLMPGAQRSMRDSFTDLGNIPILRPQQAILAHVDDDTEDSDDTLAETAHHLNSFPEPIALTTPPAQLAANPNTTATAAAARHSTGPPLRFRRARGETETNQEVSSSPKEQSDDSEGTLVERAYPATETTFVPGPATSGRRRTTEEVAIEDSPIHQSARPATPVGLRGGSGRSLGNSVRNRVHSIGQDAQHAPSPLRQTQVPGPAHQSELSSSDCDEESPVVYLQGYFSNQRDRNVDYTYTFRELFPPAPQTEPLRRASQYQHHTRSQSSNDAPTCRLIAPNPDTRNTTGSDVFWNAPTSATAEPQIDGRVGVRPRLRSSEMSNTSLAYSYYELPENRQSSGEHPVHDVLSQSQYDGSAASRQAGHGLYRSVRLSDAQSFDNDARRPPTPTTSGFAPPFPGFVGQQATSPLPAEPYTRLSTDNCPSNSDYRPTQAIWHATQDYQNRESQPDAMVAVIENRLSPLDALTTQYGRTSQRLAHQHGQHQQGTTTHQLDSRGPAHYMNSYSTPTAMADDPYTRGVSAHYGQSHNGPTRPLPNAPDVTRTSTAHHGLTYAAPRTTSARRASSAHGTPTYPVPPGHPSGPTVSGPSSLSVPSNYAALANHPGFHPRAAQTARSSQRSSENAPVGSSIQGGRAPHTTQVQDRVSTFEQLLQPR